MSTISVWRLWSSLTDQFILVCLCALQSTKREGGEEGGRLLSYKCLLKLCVLFKK